MAEPRVHPVDRYDPPGHAVFFPLGLADRVCHTAVRAFDLHASEEDVALAAMQVILYIRLVKISYVNNTAVVHRFELDEIHAAPDMRKPWGIRHDGADADAFPVHDLGDGAVLRTVVIFARKIGNKVIESKDAELVECQRLFLTYALDVSYVGIQICHYSENFKV